MSHFDQETRVVARSDDLYQGTVSPQWSIGNNPNGGYLLAIALDALQQRLPEQPDPLSVTVHYFKPGLAGQPCEVRTQLLKRGRQVSSARATLYQEGEARFEVIAVLGALGDGADTPITLPAPAIPAPEACTPRSGFSQGLESLPLLERLEIRLHPEEAEPGQAGKAQVSGWIRLRDGRAPDTRAAILFADAFPPSVFGLLGAVGWVPTVELTVHVRRRPAAGWMLGQFRTLDLSDGRMIEDGWVWDSQGQLVVQSRQLALVRKAG
ncbi:MAG: thioesterase family protein [Burkholderiaceae bacterium]